MNEKKVMTAAYVPFKTFLNALDHLHSHGLPNIIDRSVFPSLSGTAQSQLLSAMAFLGLIDEKGLPTNTLDSLVMQTDHRKENLRNILEEKYKNLFVADLTRVTPSQFEALFSPDIYGVTGDTRKKAKSFLFFALQYVGVPYSKLLTQRTRSPRKKASGNNNVGDVGKEKSDGTPPIVTAPPVTTNQTENAFKTVKLVESNKTVWIGTDANMFEIKRGKDLDFILDLIKLFDEYENGNTQTEATVGEQTTVEAS